MKAVDFMVNRALPPELRAEGRVYDAKTIAGLMAKVATDHPQDYAKVVKAISDIGRKASWTQGETVTLNDLRVDVGKAALLAKMEKELGVLEKSKLSEEEKRAKRVEIWAAHATELEAATKKNIDPTTNAPGASVLSGARGKIPQLQAMVAAPGLYTDFFGNVIPLFAGNSFAEGVRPGHFLAATYGARSSVISTKVATAKGGDLCLAETTLVRMGDRTLKPIKDIKVGDTVMGCGINGIVMAVRVTAKFEQGIKDVHTYCADGYGEVECTPNHKFLSCDGSIIPAEAICRKAGHVQVWTGRMVRPCRGWHQKSMRSRAVMCYDIEVDHKDHLFVLANGMVTSNSKQMVRSATPLVVGTKDCGTSNGIDYKIDDSSLKGRVLARDTAGLKAGTIIGAAELKRLRETKGLETVLCRSALTCEHDEGLCSKCCGVMPGGKSLPPIGYHAGMVSSQSVGEPVTQGALNCLSADTLVRMADGSDKAVKDVAIGDYVLGADTQGQFFATKVTDVFDQGVQPCRRYKFNSGAEVFATHQHQFLTSSKDHELEVLPMSTIMTCNRLKPGALSVRSVTAGVRVISDTHAGDMPCMDLEVESDYGLFVLSSGLICSNSKHCLAAGTLVRMASGESKRIEDIQEGEYVAGCTIAGAIVPTKVRRVVDQGVQQVADFVFEGRVLRSTGNHKVLGFGKHGPDKIKVESARRVFGFNDDDLTWFEESGISNPGKAHCWDISVDLDSQLFVLANGLVVSNTGGIYKGRRTYSGFDVINRIAQSPEEFEDRAVVAEKAGTISNIQPAPQGGTWVTVDDHRHYVLPGYELTCKIGDKVEAGEQLSDGVVDTGDIIRLRGLGSARRQYAERLKQALDDSGFGAESRHVETLARAAINHVRVTSDDGYGNYMPDDIANYDKLTKSLTPPASVKLHQVTPELHGKVLWQPALHYSVGTRLTPKMVDRIRKAGITQVAASHEAPGFEPEMVRLRSSAMEAGEDWLAHQNTSHLKDNLIDDAVRGRDTQLRNNSNYVAPLAYGKDFGKDVGTTGKF